MERSIYLPDEPRPAGAVAAGLHDLRALVETTFALLREGLGRATLALALQCLGLAVALSPVLVPIAYGSSLAHALIVFLVLLGAFPAIPVVPPLAVFGHLALGRRLAFGDVFHTGGAILLVFLGPYVLCYAVLVGMTILTWLWSVQEPLAAPGALLLTLFVLVALSGAVRYGPLTVLIRASVRDEDERRVALAALDYRTEGRLVLLVPVCVVPLAIFAAAASPTPFLRDLVGRALGPGGELALLLSVGTAGGVVAILLGSAMVAAAYAVIRADRFEEASG